MVWPTARVGLDLALSRGCNGVKVGFSGGEPLLELDLLRRSIGYLDRRTPRRRVVRKVVQTNGLLIDRRVAAFLAARGVEVRLSHDGVRAAQRQRGAETFDYLDRLLSRLRREQSDLFHRRLTVAVTLTAANAPFLADSVEYLVGKGVRNITVSAAVTEDTGNEGDHWDTLEGQFARVAAFSRRHFATTGEIPVQLLRGEKGRAAGRGARVPARDRLCAAGSGASVTVDVDGRLCFCATFAPSVCRVQAGYLSDGQRALTADRIRLVNNREPLDRVAAAERLPRIFTHRLAKYSRYGSCADCEYGDRCLVCPADIGYPDGRGDPDRVPAFICAFTRATLRHSDRFDSTPNATQVMHNPDLILDRLPGWLKHAKSSLTPRLIDNP